MTLAVQQPFVVYSGNGATTVFAIPFNFSSTSSYVEAILADTNDEETLQVITTNYTISGSNLTMLVAPPSNYKLYIGRKSPLEQDKDFVLSGAFRVEEAEDGLDDLAKQIQQVSAAADRALKFQKTSNGATADVPSFDGQADKLLLVNSDEDGLDFGPTLASFNASVAAAASSASAAATSASNSATSATNSANSATQSANSAIAADGSADDAADSATAAATSETNAAASAAAAAASAASAAASGSGYDIVIDASGGGTHTTWAAGIAAAVAGDSVLVKKGTYTENVTISVQLAIHGRGRSTVLDGNLTFGGSADYSEFRSFKVNGIVTLDAGADGVRGDFILGNAGSVSVDGSVTGDSLGYITES